MKIQDIIDEYSLEIDDIRWYLSHLLCQKFLSHKDRPQELTRYIWSGELASALHNMEEQFISDLQDRLDRSLLDEARAREIMREIEAVKKNRH
ncbi:MAG: hypothetical protein JXB03_10210 [Spirochaetales bacterium]|nr:hypothetical protein [Spirochaetales bacterium]